MNDLRKHGICLSGQKKTIKEWDTRVRFNLFVGHATCTILCTPFVQNGVKSTQLTTPASRMIFATPSLVSASSAASLRPIWPYRNAARVTIYEETAIVLF
jgi:hypothetical protein